MGRIGEVTLSYRTADPYDASIRLLNDAQRFGAELVSLNFVAAEELLSLTIRVREDVDVRNLSDRLGRHRAIVAHVPEAAE